MQIQKYLNKNNLHHAYLIEGARDDIALQIIKFFSELGIKTTGNSDFVHINLDSFKVEDARNLKSYGMQKSFSGEKRVFIVSVNSFLLEAQNSLLKMFEEPIENTHFFLIVPDINSLLKTFVSRFYLISSESRIDDENKEVEKFIIMPIKNRIDFIKELLAEEEDEDEEGNEIVVLNSSRFKALKFLNELELVLHQKIFKYTTGEPCVFTQGSPVQNFFEHLFKVRKFLRMPGSSAKSLMESVALIVPEKLS